MPNQSVIAVVPTFRPDPSLVERLARIAAQVDSVIVVDDHSDERSGAVLDGLIAAGFEVQRSERNGGIASALNVGTRMALARGADFVLTVDQDTDLADDYVKACLAVFESDDSDPTVGVVCADVINSSPSLPEAYTASGYGIVREAIQSGFLISRACFEECGLFDERLFIDNVDTEFCLRIALHGFVTVVGPGTHIDHALGELVPYRPWGRAVVRDGRPAMYQYHRPFRRYFIARNNIDLYFRFLRSRPRWVASSLRRELVPTVKHVLSGPYRSRQLLALIVGTVHGVVRKRGPLSTGLQRLLTPSP
jgi:rhamnosyltransferase